MEAFIGTKVVQAEPMTKQRFQEQFKGLQDFIEGGDAAGYHVVYPGETPAEDYHSWSPKSKFDEAYRLINVAERRVVSEGGK